MCEFVGWIEYEGKNYFLTSADLNTKEGRELKKFLKYSSPEYYRDISGHGAIRQFYTELKDKGINKENSDFSNPKNFPSDIISTIKKGKFCGIGICIDILNNDGKIIFNKIKDPAFAEYNRIKDSALEMYYKITNQASAEYHKIKDQSWAEYIKITNQAWTEYNKIKDQSWAEYYKITDQVFWKIAKQKKYRVDVWK